MRNVSAGFQAAVEAVAGTQLHRVLEIYFPSPTGTRKFSGGTSSGATPGVLDWGQISINCSPSQKALTGYGSVQLQIADPTLSLLALFDLAPGAQAVEAAVKFFASNDADAGVITEFYGTISTAAEWNSSSATWSVTIDGLEKRYDREVGIRYERRTFPEVRCSECGDGIVPIVFGPGVKRVPACTINHPGRSVLLNYFGICDDSLFIATTADEGGFTSGTEITLAVGFPPNNVDLITGSFASGSSTEFVITSRRSIAFYGEVIDQWQENGHTYFTIQPPNDLVNYRGLPLILPEENCSVETVTNWLGAPPGSPYRAIAQKGSDRTINNGDPVRIGSFPNYVPLFPPGTPVFEEAPYIFAVSALPAQAVTAVEAKMTVAGGLGAGQQVPAWGLYTPSLYTVNLDDRTYNAVLGRDPVDDPGITTITLERSPQSLGFNDSMIYVTLDGLTDGNPASVIQELAGNAFLGAIPSARINSTSFAAAVTALDGKVMQFAYTKVVKLWQAIADLAWQSGMSVAFFDVGQLHLKYWPAGTPGAADVELTLDQVASKGWGLAEIDSRQAKNRLVAKWKNAQTLLPGQPEGIIVRRAPEAIEAFGENEETITVYAYQDGDTVSDVTQEVLLRNLTQNRLVKARVYAMGATLQPGDAVRCNFAISGGVSVDYTGRVRAISRTAIDTVKQVCESYGLEVEVALHDWDVEATVVENCETPASVPNTSNPGGPIASFKGQDDNTPTPTTTETTTDTTTTGGTTGPTTVEGTTDTLTDPDPCEGVDCGHQGDDVLCCNWLWTYTTPAVWAQVSGGPCGGCLGGDCCTCYPPDRPGAYAGEVALTACVAVEPPPDTTTADTTTSPPETTGETTDTTTTGGTTDTTTGDDTTPLTDTTPTTPATPTYPGTTTGNCGAGYVLVRYVAGDPGPCDTSWHIVDDYGCLETVCWSGCATMPSDPGSVDGELRWIPCA